MKKTAVKPLNIIGIMLTLTGLLFPAVFIYGIFLIISVGFTASSVFICLVSAILIYGISINAFRLVFLPGFTFYDDYFEVLYFDSSANRSNGNFFKINKPKSLKIKYSDIDKFGSFEGHQMRKNGRDENNNLQIAVSVKGVPVCFSLPCGFENAGNYFVINDVNGSGFLVNGKLYSASQVRKILQNIESFSAKEATGGYPEVPNLIPLAVIGGVVMTAFVPFALTGLECRLNPAHSRAVDSPGRTVYFLCCMFFFISVFANVLYSKAPDSDAKKSVKIILYSVSAVLLAVTAAVFVITVLN